MTPSSIPEIASWEAQQYALVDSGGFEKLERFGGLVLSRPEPLAIWPKRDPRAWEKADVRYVPQGKDGMEGEWETRRQPGADWSMTWNDLRFGLRPTAFKHVGVFPEQAVNWDWIRRIVKPGMQVLNLFGYTGGATIAAASAGAEVVHLDASKPSVEWAKENARRSGLGDAKIRYIVDDAVKFVAREARRGRRYDAILMDPPAFGRGPEGELWKFERDLPPLLDAVVALLPEKNGHLLLNTYSLGFPGTAIAQLVREAVPAGATIESIETTLKEEGERGFLLPTGIATRATW